jgi:hypothetical protein
MEWITKKSYSEAIKYSIAIISTFLTVLPEDVFSLGFITVDFSTYAIIIINRIILSVVTFGCVLAALWVKQNSRNSIVIQGNDIKIQVEYGDIFEMKDCKKVIAFDECFTTKIGEAPADIKTSSICGQFLSRFKKELPSIKKAIAKSDLLKYESTYNNQKCSESGRIVVYKDFFLMAFAKLNNQGLGYMSREEYQQCLSVLWKELDKYYAQHDVAITILGAGITRFKDASLTKQQLIDIIIASYKLSTHKIKNTLHIVCANSEDFSLNKVGEYI